MMSTDDVPLDLSPSGVMHLQLNRPERLNTLAPDFFPALRDAVQAPDTVATVAHALALADSIAAKSPLQRALLDIGDMKLATQAWQTGQPAGVAALEATPPLVAVTASKEATA